RSVLRPTLLPYTTLFRSGGTNGLPKIGPAPDFTLTTQDGARMSLRDLRGKVVAVTFIYASCTDTCPLLTAKMAALQAKLGPEFGDRKSTRLNSSHVKISY